MRGGRRGSGRGNAGCRLGGGGGQEDRRTAGARHVPGEVATGTASRLQSHDLRLLDNPRSVASFRANNGGGALLLREGFIMAKATTIKVKLVSSADTGFYYVTKKNSRTMTDKLVKKKYDPVAKKHVEFRESKIK